MIYKRTENVSNYKQVLNTVKVTSVKYSKGNMKNSFKHRTASQTETTNAVNCTLVRIMGVMLIAPKVTSIR